MRLNWLPFGEKSGNRDRTFKTGILLRGFTGDYNFRNKKNAMSE